MFCSVQFSSVPHLNLYQLHTIISSLVYTWRWNVHSVGCVQYIVECQNGIYSPLREHECNVLLYQCFLSAYFSLCACTEPWLHYDAYIVPTVNLQWKLTQSIQWLLASSYKQKCLIGWEHCLLCVYMYMSNCPLRGLYRVDMYWSSSRMLFGWSFQVNRSACGLSPLFPLLGYHTTPLCALLHLHNRVAENLRADYLLPISFP